MTNVPEVTLPSGALLRHHLATNYAAGISAAVLSHEGWRRNTPDRAPLEEIPAASRGRNSGKAELYCKRSSTGPE